MHTTRMAKLLGFNSVMICHGLADDCWFQETWKSPDESFEVISSELEELFIAPRSHPSCKCVRALSCYGTSTQYR
jgi:hypothetical protein